MNRFLCRFLGYLLGQIFFCATLYAQELQLITEENPPITFSQNDEPKGVLVDIVQELLVRTKTQAPIRILPWARAYKMSLSIPNIGLFPNARTPERETLFQWVGPIYQSVGNFYAKNDSHLKVSSEEEAKQLESILVPREWYTHQLLVKKGFTNLHAVNTPEQMVMLLFANRAPVMFATTPALYGLLSKMGKQISDVKMVFSLTKTYGYIGFSKETSPELVRQWQLALDNMKRDGTFAKIYAKWLPHEIPVGISPEH